MSLIDKKLNDWRLVTEVSAIFDLNNSNIVYLSSHEKKKDEETVIKKYSKKIANFRTLLLEENKFEIKLDNSEYSENFVIKARSNEFPKPDNWYTVVNFDNSQLNSIILENKINKGCFDNPEFEAIFSDDPILDGKVSFINSSMLAYSDCFEKFNRKLNWEICKKTKKLIPGHKYDLEKESRYFIGKFYSRKKKLHCSEFCVNDDMVECYLYVNYIRDTYTKLSDILNNEHFGEGKFDIKVEYKFSTMVDCGEVLTNDVKEIRDYWSTLLKTSCTSMTDNNLGDKVKNILDIYCYQDDKDSIKNITEVDKELIKKSITDLMNEFIEKNLDRVSYFPEFTLSMKNSDENNITSCIRFFYKELRDINIEKENYYKELFNNLGINLRDISNTVLSQFITEVLLPDYDSFYKHYLYFTRQGNHYSSDQLKTTKKIVKIEDILNKESELYKTIIELINYSGNNFGIGVSKYIVSDSCPENVTCFINLKDIVNFKKDNMSEKLKEDIVNNKFIDIQVQFNINKKVE